MISLTRRRRGPDTRNPVLQNTSTSGSPSRKSKAIFSSNGFTPMGGMEQRYKTLTGKAARRLVAVLNILPTSLQNEAQVSTRSNSAMPSASSCATLRAQINTPGFAELKFLAKHFAAMCRADQLTILALVHDRARAERSRKARDPGQLTRNVSVRKGAK